MSLWHDFHGPNAAYVLDLYEQYQRDPASVDTQTQAYFEQLQLPTNGVEAVAEAPTAVDTAKIVGAVNLASAIREYGHLAAQLDPLGAPIIDDPALDPAFHGITEADLHALPASLIGGPIAQRTHTAYEAIHELRHVYSTRTGYDYDHLREPNERTWLREAAEARRFYPTATEMNGMLERLTQVEQFERFLHRTFPGKTRFSIEGLDMLVPMLDEIIAAAVQSQINALLLGMAHRGRLNVLAHILNKSYTEILAEFRDPVEGRSFFQNEAIGFLGDVKYHAGASRDVAKGQTAHLQINMAPNPSHLEAVNPVVAGMARAAGTRVDRPGEPTFERSVSLPVLIHGDASFVGQGIVGETLNLSRLKGYHTGGTIHIIANNNLGYTTLPNASRSTIYASDLAKGFKIPIVHVNADDPEACIEAARLAAAYLEAFQRDFLIDLVGYRRYGHNEGDDPSFTQPLLYQTVNEHPTVRELWANTLVEREAIAADVPDKLASEALQKIQDIYDSLEPAKDLGEQPPETPPPGAARSAQTGITFETLQAINQALGEMPAGFTPYRKLSRILERRRTAFDSPDEPLLDWAAAEELALASILAEGTAIRMTGQDVERGTFSQRHAMLHDPETGDSFAPLQHFSHAQASFEIYNSPLSEAAAIGFEYGYNVQAPDRLVIWEAQYGDFINGAQTIVDEFITSARSKWGGNQTPSLVLLLPHGYEGAGPDHSTGRLERFLQMAAETNMRIANCTTAAQYFHLLRRQASLLKTDPLPLVLMTPKSLLRHPKVASSARELVDHTWQPVIDDATADTEKVRHLVLCSGKIYIDLTTLEHRPDTLAIARVEQLYPFPKVDLEPVLQRYPNLERVVWVQEEPENMGAWLFLQPHLIELINGRYQLHHITRPRSSSPAEGSMAWHNVNQKALLNKVFNLA